MSLLDLINNRISELTAATDAKYKAAGYEVPTASQRKAAEYQGVNPYEYATQLKAAETAQKEAEKAAKKAAKAAQKSSSSSSKSSGGSYSYSSGGSYNASSTEENSTRKASDLWASESDDNETIPSVKDFQQMQQESFQRKKARRRAKGAEKQLEEYREQRKEAVKQAWEENRPKKLGDREHSTPKEDPTQNAPYAGYAPFGYGSMEKNLYDIRNAEMGQMKAQADYNAEISQKLEQYRQEYRENGNDFDELVQYYNENHSPDQYVTPEQYAAMVYEKEKQEAESAKKEAETANLVINKDNVSDYLDTNYQLNENEQKAAQEYIDQFKKDKVNYDLYMAYIDDAATHVDHYNKEMGTNYTLKDYLDGLGITMDEYQEALAVEALEQKISNTAAFMSGLKQKDRNLAQLPTTIGDALTGGAISEANAEIERNATEAEKAANLHYDIEKARQKRIIESQKTQSPFAYTGGVMTKMAVDTAFGNMLLNGVGIVDTVASMAGGGPLAKALSEIGLETAIVDIPTDTIPEMIENYNNGMPVDEVLKQAGINIAVNTGINALMDVGLPGFMNLVKKGIPNNALDLTIKNGDDLYGAIDNLSDTAIPSLKPAKNLVKTADDVEIDNLIKQQEEAQQAIEDLTKQLPETPEDTLKSMEDLQKPEEGKITYTSAEDQLIPPKAQVEDIPKIWEDYVSGQKYGNLEINSLDNSVKTFSDYVDDLVKASTVDESVDILNRAANSLKINAISENEYETLLKMASGQEPLNNLASAEKALTGSGTRSWLDAVEPNTGATVGDIANYYTEEMKTIADNFGTKYADIINGNDIVKQNYEALQKAVDDFTDAALHTDENLDAYYRKIDATRKNLSNKLKAAGEIGAAKDPALGNSNISVLKNADRAKFGIFSNKPDDTLGILPGMEDLAGMNKEDAAKIVFGEDQAKINSITDYPENAGIPNNPRTIAESTGAGPASAPVDIPPQGTSAPKAQPQTQNPDVTTGKFGESRVVSNTAVNAKVIDAKALQKDPVIKDIAKYEKHSNAKTLTEAIDRIDNAGQEWLDGFIDGSKTISGDTDVDTAMLLLQDISKKLDGAVDPREIEQLTAQRNLLLSRLRNYGTNTAQGLQSFAKWNNTADGAILNATGVMDDAAKSWKTTNVKAADGNSRIALALSKMGDDTKTVTGASKQLTHDEIKKGVLAEIEREYGSISKQLTDDDLEYLTMLAEDKSIPVWEITSELEHKFKTGDWYTLDEGFEVPKPTNQKLNNALNSLVGEKVRAEKVPKTYDQILQEVKNTFDKEPASFYDNFTDNDFEYIANLIDHGATRQELEDVLNTKLATGNFGISAEAQQQVTDLFKAANMYNINSKKFAQYQAQALGVLANEINLKATAFEKFESWRYLAMLGNPKTMLRNLVGNATFSVLNGFSNSIAALGESGIDKLIKGGKSLSNKLLGTDFDATTGIQRTKSIINPTNKADRSMLKAAWDDADNSAYKQLSGTKYEKMDKGSIKNAKSTFDSKFMQGYEKAVDIGISDYPALKTKYTTSLTGYLKANGYDASIFDAEDTLKRLQNLGETRLLTQAEQDTIESLTKDVDALKKAREYAIEQAQYATFHEDNAVADALSRASSFLRNSDNKILNAGGMVLEGTIPFKKTPANILRSGLEYSPLGAIDSIKKTGKLIYENTGKRAGNLADTYINAAGKEVKKTLAADVIDSWSKTLSGTGLAGLGFYLYNKGILNISTPELKYQDQLEGKQNYSIIINGHSYTIDWSVPAAMPLFLGAELAQLWPSLGQDTGDFYKNLDSYMNIANRIADPLIETSMLSGIQDTIETAASAAQYNENINIPTLLLWNSLTGYGQQAIPTFAGQLARTIDNTRRSTYTDKEGVAGVLDKQTKKLMNKIPGLSMLNEPYVDTYGREQSNSPFDNPILNFGYQTLSPGYYAKVNTTQADELSRNAFDVNQNEATLPDWQSSIKMDGEKVSPEDYYKGSKAAGQAQYDIRTALANDEWFNSLSPAQQEEIVSKINTLAIHVGKAAIDPEYSVESNAFKAYQEGGTDGLIEFYKEDAKKQNIRDIGKENGANITANETALDIYDNGISANGITITGDDAVALYAQAVAWLKENNVTNNPTNRQIYYNGHISEFANNDTRRQRQRPQNVNVDGLTEIPEEAVPQSGTLPTTGSTYTEPATQPILPDMQLTQYTPKPKEAETVPSLTREDAFKALNTIRESNQTLRELNPYYDRMEKQQSIPSIADTSNMTDEEKLILKQEQTEIMSKYGLSYGTENAKLLNKYGETALEAKGLLNDADYDFGENEKKLYKNGGVSAIQDYVETRTALDNAGLDSSYTVYEAYLHALQTYPDMTPAQYATAVKKIDANDDSTINQKELAAYLTENGYTVQEAEELAKVMGNWSTTPYITKKGTWAFH